MPNEIEVFDRRLSFTFFTNDKKSVIIYLTFEKYQKGDTNMKKWVCTVCGYIHEGEEAPEICPLCGVGAEDFTEVEE